MTQKVFIKHKEVNTSFVWLYLERMFRKAFERSAFAFHTRVKEFCVLHKESKILGRDILYFGFTQTVFGKKYSNLLLKPIDEKTFLSWLASTYQ